MNKERVLVIRPAVTVKEREEIENTLRKLNYNVLGGGQSYNQFVCMNESYINYEEKSK